MSKKRRDFIHDPKRLERIFDESKSHSSDVNSICYSPDGKRVLSGSNDNSIKEWDAMTGDCIRTYEGHNDPVKSVCYRPDGMRIASGSVDGTIKEWDVLTGECVSTYNHGGWVSTVHYFQDGSKIISGSSDETVKEWDVMNGECIRTYKGHGSHVDSAVYSPDGKKILSGCADNTIKEWDVISGNLIRTYKGHTTSVRAVSYSPDGRKFISGSMDRTMREWNVTTGDCIRVYKVNTGSVECLCYSPDGKKVVSGGRYDKTVKEWDVEMAECIKTYEGHGSDIYSVNYSPDGKKILSGSYDRTIKEWDVETGKCTRTYCDLMLYVGEIFRKSQELFKSKILKERGFFSDWFNSEDLRKELEDLPWVLSLEGYYLHDLEDLCGLYLNETVDYRESNELRFHYLFNECCPPGFSLKDGNEGYHQEWNEYFKDMSFKCEELENEEKEIDRLKDELHKKIKDLEEYMVKDKLSRQELKDSLKVWLRNNKIRIHEDHILPFFETPKLPATGRNIMADIEKILRTEWLVLKEKEKKKTSDEIYRILKSEGVKFNRLMIEGVLGEYSFNGKLITLYPKMMELLLPELSLELNIKSDYQAFSSLKSVVKIHESVHATWHLGEDKNGDGWKNPMDFSFELHETIAQYYTAKMIDHLPLNEALKDMFSSLNKKLTTSYHLFNNMEHSEPEAARMSFLRMRKKGYSSLTYESLMGNILKNMTSLYEFYQRMPPSETKITVQKLIKTLLKGEVPLDMALQYIKELKYIPQAKDTIELTLKRALPDKDEIISLYLEALYKNGVKNGDAFRYGKEYINKGQQTPRILPEVLKHPDIIKIAETVK